MTEKAKSKQPPSHNPTNPAPDSGDDGASINTAAYYKIDSSPDISDDETLVPSSPRVGNKEPLKIFDHEGWFVSQMKRARIDSSHETAPMSEEQERIMMNEAELQSMRERKEAEEVRKEIEVDVGWASEEEELDLGSSGEGSESGSEGEDTLYSGDEGKGNEKE